MLGVPLSLLGNFLDRTEAAVGQSGVTLSRSRCARGRTEVEQSLIKIAEAIQKFNKDRAPEDCIRVDPMTEVSSRFSTM
jgi:hypothetical protein